jgi:alpha-tubulin suppressor-like RCC1 family protein
VLAGKAVNAISAGLYHVVALADDGQLYGWGDNLYSQLGNGNTTTALLPVAVTMTGLAGKTVSAIYSGPYHNYAVTSDNLVFGWGFNSTGQLGNNSTATLSVPSPVVFAGALAGKTVLPTSYALGTAHTLAFDTTGKVYAWGANGNGQLGISSLERFGIPVAVAGRELNIKTFTQVAAGGDFAVALASDGSVFSWGANGNGQLGNAAAGTPSSQGWAIAGGSLNASSVSLTGVSTVSGSLRVTATSTAGVVVGMAVAGTSNIPAGTTVQSVTNGTTFQLSAPATASGSGLSVTASGQFTQTPVTALAAGQRHVVAVAGGKVYAWGYNAFGQAGDASTTDRSTPVLTVGTGVLSGKTITSVAAGLNHSVALDSTGTLYAWGAGASGQLGNGTTTVAQTSPVAITGGSLAGRVVTAVAAGGNRGYAIAGGSLYGWGENAGGMLGNGGTANSTSPVLINGGSLAGKTVTHVAAGYNHTVVRTSDGLLFAWGANDRGQLGTGNLTSASIPVAVKMSGALAGKTALRVFAGPASLATIVLASDNKLYTWGGRGLGQLGNGSWGTTLEAVQVSVTGPFVSAAAGDGFSVSASSENFVSTWGAGELGQLANGMDGMKPARGLGGFDEPFRQETGFNRGGTRNSVQFAELRCQPTLPTRVGCQRDCLRLGAQRPGAACAGHTGLVTGAVAGHCWHAL